MYADYKYYKEIYSGKAIKSDGDFQRFEKMAKKLLDKVTLQRCVTMTPVHGEVKDAICAAADIYCKFSGKENIMGIKSENNSGYSVSYSDDATDAAYVDKVAYAKIKFYLEGTGLLLRRRNACDNKYKPDTL